MAIVQLQLLALPWFLSLVLSSATTLVGAPTKPLPLAPLLRLPGGLRGASGHALDIWFTPLKPPAAALPERPVQITSQGKATPQGAQPPPAASLAYDVGGIYAGLDVDGGWQLVRLARGPDSEGTFVADVLANISSLGGDPVVLDRWPKVYGMPEFLRPTPPPPPPSVVLGYKPPPGMPVFVKGQKTGEWVVDAGFGKRGDDQKTPEFVLYPGNWPLTWSQGMGFHTAAGGAASIPR
eukprot:TRINITY_DN80613_c0_g1_i1.p1 TRINITY_DN80613_c0_g1~~TRINITY_DN80613_c0_g1_i1.p1  ORF type:complete len:237 (-),score=27.34 TRINITY_DN80613_c0_g1_i1:190-900(-)